MGRRSVSDRRSLAFVLGPPDAFLGLAAVLDSVMPGSRWDFVCFHQPAVVPDGARILRARRSLVFVLRLWMRALLRRYHGIYLAGEQLDRMDSGTLRTLVAALPAPRHAAIDRRGRTASIDPLTPVQLLSLAASVVLLAVAKGTTRIGLWVMPSSPAPVRRGGRTAILVPVLPDISHTFVYREVLELKRQHPDYLVIALERGDDSVMHREAAELLAQSDLVPKDAPHRYLLRYLGFWVRRPRAIASVIRRFAPHAGSFGPGHANDPYSFTRLEYLHNPNYVMVGLTLARHLEREGVGYVHVYGSTFPSVRALVAHGLTGIRFSVSTFVDFDYQTPFHMLPEKMSAACFVVTCTQYCATELQRRFPSLADRFTVVRHGLPRDYTCGKTLRARDGRSRLVYVGRFVPKKGLDTLLEACRLLMGSGTRFSCHLYGNGQLREELERFVAAWRLDDVVVFEGVLANEHFYSAVNHDDIFVCPSRYMEDGERDGIPVSMMEAMAAGITVVSTPVSGIPELITDGENGYLVPPNDPAALAETLARLIANPALREAVSAPAASTIRERFSVERAVARLDELIARAR